MTPELLTMLKTDLGITTTAYDARLSQVLRAAEGEIRREGGRIDPGRLDDCQLVVMYAAWLWRRRDDMSGMPRMLRWALNNHVFARKMRGESDGPCT